MCNLYSINRGQEAMRRLFEVERDLTGNLPPMPGVYPDMPAPIVRVTDGLRELALARWGMPGPPQFGGAPITNICNTSSPHWRRWLGPANRCLVPVTSFCEWAQTKPKKTPTWFALDDERPLFAFVGIWTTWTGTRGTMKNPIEGKHQVYGFLTTDANGVVGPACRCRACSRRRNCGAVRPVPISGKIDRAISRMLSHASSRLLPAQARCRAGVVGRLHERGSRAGARSEWAHWCVRCCRSSSPSASRRSTPPSSTPRCRRSPTTSTRAPRPPSGR